MKRYIIHKSENGKSFVWKIVDGVSQLAIHNDLIFFNAENNDPLAVVKVSENILIVRDIENDNTTRTD